MSLTAPFDSEGKSWISSSARINSGAPAALGSSRDGALWSLGARRGWAELSHILVSGECATLGSAESSGEGLVLSDTEVQQWSAGLSLWQPGLAGALTMSAGVEAAR